MSAHLCNLELGFGHATVRFLARARARADLAEERERAVLGGLLPAWMRGGRGGPSQPTGIAPIERRD